MDPEILKTLGQIAGIGGVSIGLALLVFRDLIRKNIFPKFKDEKLAYSLLRLIVVLSWSIAIVGIGAWLFIKVAEARTPISIPIESAEFKGPVQIASMELILNEYIEMKGESLR